MRYAPLAERFERHYIPEPMSGCFIWTAALHKDGYGYLAKGNYRPGDGSSMLHRCDNPTCVNPDHLFLGTHSDNMRDAVTKGRKNIPRGAKHGNASISEDQAREIKFSEESGIALARRFGVGVSTVSRIRLRQSWKHI